MKVPFLSQPDGHLNPEASKHCGVPASKSCHLKVPTIELT